MLHLALLSELLQIWDLTYSHRLGLRIHHWLLINRVAGHLGGVILVLLGRSALWVRVSLHF